VHDLKKAVDPFNVKESALQWTVGTANDSGVGIGGGQVPLRMVFLGGGAVSSLYDCTVRVHVDFSLST